MISPPSVATSSVHTALHLHVTPQKMGMEESFAWTDFLDVQEDSPATKAAAELSTTSRHSLSSIDLFTSSMERESTSIGTPNFFLQREDYDYDDEVDMKSCATAATASMASLSTTSSESRRVTFADRVRVRTFPVTLGDHPCCPGGMALQCDYNNKIISDAQDVDLAVFERNSRKRRKQALRLTYADRRQRLVEQTGLSPARLLQIECNLVHDSGNSSNQCQDECNARSVFHTEAAFLRRSSPSSTHLHRQGYV